MEYLKEPRPSPKVCKRCKTIFKETENSFSIRLTMDEFIYRWVHRCEKCAKKVTLAKWDYRDTLPIPDNKNNNTNKNQ
jgi:hypothetical protein